MHRPRGPGAGVGGRGWGDEELGSSRPRGSGRLWVSVVWGRQLTPAAPFLPDSALSKEALRLPGLGAQSERSWACRLLAPPWDPIGLPLCLTACPPPREHSALVWGADRPGVCRALLLPALQKAPTASESSGHSPARPSPGFPAGVQNPPRAAAWPSRTEEGQPGCCCFALGPWEGQGPR